jgi:hypothetical protein
MLLACADDLPLDVRDHWPLHAALRDLEGWLKSQVANEESWVKSGMPSLRFVKDPDVGLRARGVTRAIWDLVGDGVLVYSIGRSGRPVYRMADGTRSEVHRKFLTLSPQCAAAFQVAGQRFSHNATIAS